MNISAFSMPLAAYLNPEVAGGDGLGARLVHGLTHVLIDQKFMGLFSLLFGAGVVLFTDRLDGSGRKTALLHYRRSLWLLVIGLAHSVLLWEGDVLVVYAACALVLYPLRSVRASILVALAVACLVTIPVVRTAAITATIEAGDGAALQAFFDPPPDRLDEAVTAHRDGTYGELVGMRWSSADFDGPPLVMSALLWDIFARAFGMMLLGIVLYKAGILSATASAATYRRMVFTGSLIGLPIAALGLVDNYRQGWEASHAMGVGVVANLVATVALSLSYVGLVMLWSRTGRAQGLQARLAAVGQTALTNYILQSVIATAVFHGWGLGLYGRLDRPAQLMVVAAIWALQLAVSPWWIARFRFGPLEWLWRTLTYLRPQPMRRSAA